jgi:hypothetical protein
MIKQRTHNMGFSVMLAKGICTHRPFRLSAAVRALALVRGTRNKCFQFLHEDCKFTKCKFKENLILILVEPVSWIENYLVCHEPRQRGFLKTEGVFFKKLFNVPGYHFKPYF